MLLSEFVESPELLAEYRIHKEESWFILLCSALQETLCQPVLPQFIGSASNESACAVCLGECAGSWKMLKGFRDLDKMIGENPEVLKETYNTDPTEPVEKTEEESA